MTTPDFQQRHPKPWRFVVCDTTFSLRDANDKVVGNLGLSNYHSDIPQKEWNRHIAAALREHITVSEDEGSVVNQSKINHRYSPALQRAIDAIRTPTDPKS